MSGMSTPEPTAPPGLPPATAVYRLPWTVKLQAVSVLVAALLLLVAVKGDWPPSAGVLVLIAGCAVVLGLMTLRREVCVGPGWLATQGLLRRRFVRTDQLARATETRSGLDRVVVLTDRDGRRVGVLAGTLRQDRRLHRLLADDVRSSVAGGLVLTDRCARLLGVG
jgi:hypothetical protein